MLVAPIQKMSHKNMPLTSFFKKWFLFLSGEDIGRQKKLAEKSLPNVKSLKDKNKEIVAVIPLTPNGSWTIQPPEFLC